MSLRIDLVVLRTTSGRCEAWQPGAKSYRVPTSFFLRLPTYEKLNFHVVLPRLNTAFGCGHLYRVTASCEKIHNTY